MLFFKIKYYKSVPPPPPPPVPQLLHKKIQNTLFMAMNSQRYLYVIGVTNIIFLSPSPIYTAKTKHRHFETNIPRKGISGPQSQFPHSCICEWFIYIFPPSVCIFYWRKYVDRSWDYINRSQTHDVEIGAEAACDFRCSVPPHPPTAPTIFSVLSKLIDRSYALLHCFLTNSSKQ